MAAERSVTFFANSIDSVISAISTRLSRSRPWCARRVPAQPRLFEAALGRDACPFDFLGGGDLGLLESLPFGDLQPFR